MKKGGFKIGIKRHLRWISGIRRQDLEDRKPVKWRLP